MKSFKKPFRAISFMLVCCLLAVSVFSSQAFAATSNDSPNVQLYYAQQGGPGEAAYDGYFGSIAVKNLGYEKKVTLHYTQDGVNWSDSDASYSKADPNDSEYDIWTFAILSPSSPITFTIKYEVNGQTYWDNNNGNDYSLNSSTHAVLGKSVIKTIKQYSFSPYIIYLKNISYEKTVKIRYTTDNWASYQESDATYYQAQNADIDEWTIPSSVPKGNNVRFEVLYTVNGTTYIDNNFGDFYSNY